MAFRSVRHRQAAGLVVARFHRNQKRAIIHHQNIEPGSWISKSIKLKKHKIIKRKPHL